MFLRRDRPLAGKEHVSLAALAPFPCPGFCQGMCESRAFAEEPFSMEDVGKRIRMSDRAAVVTFMIGLDGSTLSNGILPRFQQGDGIMRGHTVLRSPGRRGSMTGFVLANVLVDCFISVFMPGPGNILPINCATTLGWKRGLPAYLGIFAEIPTDTTWFRFSAPCLCHF